MCSSRVVKVGGSGVVLLAGGVGEGDGSLPPAPAARGAAAMTCLEARTQAAGDYSRPRRHDKQPQQPEHLTAGRFRRVETVGATSRDASAHATADDIVINLHCNLQTCKRP